MFEFLNALFEWFGGFAMLFLGISYVEPVTCDAVPELLPIHYLSEDVVQDSMQTDCASFEFESEEPSHIYRV